MHTSGWRTRTGRWSGYSGLRTAARAGRTDPPDPPPSPRAGLLMRTNRSVTMRRIIQEKRQQHTTAVKGPANHTTIVTFDYDLRRNN